MSDVIQITKTKQTSTFLDYIQSKYELLNEDEIIRLLICKEYNFLQNQEIDETEYLLSNPVNKQRLLDAIKQDDTSSQKFKNIDDLKNHLKF
jgi:PHD/YefM family antitoxin component YafN of YafNO toxin-antitoxin module